MYRLASCKVQTQGHNKCSPEGAAKHYMYKGVTSQSTSRFATKSVRNFSLKGRHVCARCVFVFTNSCRKLDRISLLVIIKRTRQSASYICIRQCISVEKGLVTTTEVCVLNVQGQLY